MDEKQQKFEELAQKRVNNANHAIELIGKLASPAYHYTQQMITEIFDYLQHTLDETKKKFAPKEKAAPKVFSFQSRPDSEETPAPSLPESNPEESLGNESPLPETSDASQL